MMSLPPPPATWSFPAPASIRSLPFLRARSETSAVKCTCAIASSAWSPYILSSPSPPLMVSSSWPPLIVSSPAPPMIVSLPSPANTRSAPSPASMKSSPRRNVRVEIDLGLRRYNREATIGIRIVQMDIPALSTGYHRRAPLCDIFLDMLPLTLAIRANRIAPIHEIDHLGAIKNHVVAVRAKQAIIAGTSQDEVVIKPSVDHIATGTAIQTVATGQAVDLVIAAIAPARTEQIVVVRQWCGVVRIDALKVW